MLSKVYVVVGTSLFDGDYYLLGAFEDPADAKELRETAHGRAYSQVRVEEVEFTLRHARLDDPEATTSGTFETACSQIGPRGFYACTQKVGHKGPHMARIPDGTVVEAWPLELEAQ